MIYIERWKEHLERFIELSPEEKNEMLDAMETMLDTYEMHRQAEDMKIMGIWHDDEEQDQKDREDLDKFGGSKNAMAARRAGL